MRRTITLRIQDGDDIFLSTIPINPEGPIIWEPIAQILRNRYKDPIILETKYTQLMRAILIDADKQTVREIEIDKDNFLSDCYRHIGNGCQLIEGVSYLDLPDNHYMYVDEEGLMNTAEKGFGLFHCVFVGNAIITKDNEEGDDIDATLTLEEIESEISWISDVSPFKL